MILPKNTILGNLQLENVYEFYDIPRIFTCIGTHPDKQDQSRYWVLSLCDNENSDTFLYLRVSDQRMQEIYDKKITLADAYKNPEDGIIYNVECGYYGDSEVKEVLYADVLDGDWPSPDYSPEDRFDYTDTDQDIPVGD